MWLVSWCFVGISASASAELVYYSSLTNVFSYYDFIVNLLDLYIKITSVLIFQIA